MRGISVRPPFARVDPIGLPLAARSLGRAAREADQLWVVAATAHYGLAAARSGRPYACWIATSLDAEWAARRPALDPLRRAALAAFGPSLRRYERDVLRGARRVYATSPYTRATVAEAAGLDPAAVELLPIAVDLERFKPIDDDVWQLGARPPDARVRRPRRRSAQERRHADRGLRGVRRRVPEARLRFVGSPPQATLGPGVETVGVVGDVAEHVRDAAVLVLPSLQEGFGVVAAEAMACGVPVVSTPSGGPEETLSRSSAGRVLDGFSAEELVSVVHELLEHPQQLLEMRRRGRELRRARALATAAGSGSSPTRSPTWRRMPAPSVAVVIGNWEGERVLGDCLASLAEQSLPPAEVVVVDASSADGSAALARAHGARVLIRPNRGLGYLYNEGARAVRADYVLCANNDVALDAPCLELLAAALDEDPYRFAADPQQLDWSGERLVHARVTLRRGPLLRQPLPGFRLDLGVPAQAVVPRSAQTEARCWCAGNGCSSWAASTRRCSWTSRTSTCAGVHGCAPGRACTCRTPSCGTMSAR